MLKFLVLFTCCVVLSVGKDDISLPQCNSNEELRCVRRCPPEKTCRSRFIHYRCMDVDEPCTLKCVCVENYFRNFLGTCIRGKECDKCPGDNEFFACDSACDNDCSTLSKQNRTNCPIKNITCNRQCYCDDGYARDEKGDCIPQDKCPPTPKT